jgi:hypothetical protein
MNRSSEPFPLNTFEEFVELSDQIIPVSWKIAQDGNSQPAHAYPPKITLSPITGKIRELRISKSLVRHLIYKGEPYPVCPYKVYHCQLLRDIITAPSESMVKGLYFESRCIGSSAGGEIITDLTRHKKTGKKLSDHERIDHAVELFHQVVKDYQLIVDPHYTQIYRKRRWIDPARQSHVPVYLDGTLDFISPIATPRYSFDAATIDLKLTKDRDVTDSFSNGLFHSSPWGAPERMDFIEATMYRLLFEMPFVYLVFDFKKENPGFKDIPIVTHVNDPDSGKANLAQQRMNDLYTTLRWVSESIFRWEALRWPMEPDTLVCAKCVILDCPSREERIEI